MIGEQRRDRMAGKLISLEGGEGSGKSTQVKLLVGAFERAGRPFACTREPGGTPGAESIRKLLLEGAGDRWDPVTETILFAAARRDHYQKFIKPALETGETVLCDRFIDSTRAYQGAGRGVSNEVISELQRLAIGDFAPDLTIIFDVPVEIGLRRAASRSGKADRFEEMEIEFHERLRLGYQAIAQIFSDRCVVIDAAPEIEVVHRRVMETIQLRFGGGTEVALLEIEQ